LNEAGIVKEQSTRTRNLIILAAMAVVSIGVSAEAELSGYCAEG